jgi:cytochrome o ubiquinol oxidase operon protein cyoD
MKKSFEVVNEKFESSRDALFSYIAGFFLSLFLTIIPYVMVTEQMLDRKSSLIWIFFFAVAQLCVQVLFFLHLPAKEKPYWNIIA